MSAAAEMLAELRARGVRIRRDGERLRLWPAHALTAELIERARHLKPELLQLLRRPPALNVGLAVHEVLAYPAAHLANLPAPFELVLDPGRQIVHVPSDAWTALLAGAAPKVSVGALLDARSLTLRAVVIAGDGADA